MLGETIDRIKRIIGFKICKNILGDNLLFIEALLWFVVVRVGIIYV